MKKITRIFHVLLTLSLVFLPMRAVMASSYSPASIMPVESEVQVVDHHAGTQNHHDGMSHEMMIVANMQADNPSTDCHDHNMTDCEACALHCTLKKDIEISGLPITPNLYTYYSVPAVSLVLSRDIRPPIS
jgi:hypothetical protein